MSEVVSVQPGPLLGIGTVPEPAFSPACAFQSSDVLTPGVRLQEFPTDDVGGLDLGRNPGESFTIEAWLRIPGSTGRSQTIIEKDDPRNYGLYVAPIGPREGRLHFSYQPAGEFFNCPSYSRSRVDDGAAHHVALRFLRLPSGRRRISFFIDGVLDQSRSTCTPGGPSVNGTGGSSAVIGERLIAGGRIGEVRLYHYGVTDAQIAVHAAGGP